MMDNFPGLENLLKITKINPKELNNEYNESFFENKISLIIPYGAKIIKESEYEKFSTNNKNNSNKPLNNKRTSEEALGTGPNKILTENVNFKNKKFKTKSNAIQDPEKKIFSTWTVSKLEEEINKVKKNIEEYESSINNEEKKKKEVERFCRMKNKWLKISQDAIYTILEMFPQNHSYERNTIKSIINHFKIDKGIIEYDSENECFKDL
jgi:hypothetical protein